MKIDFNTLSATQAYHLMTQTVVPRPIAWVLTENQADSRCSAFNLAPFSYFNAVCSNPPTLMISIGLKPAGAEKDTLVNVRRSEKLVIHIATASQISDLNQTAASLPYGTSELEAGGLSTVPMDDFSLPRLKGAPIAFACKLDHIHEIGAAPQSLVFARIESAWIDDELVQIDEERGRTYVDAARLDPLARLGGANYAVLGKHKTLKRPE